MRALLSANVFYVSGGNGTISSGGFLRLLDLTLLSAHLNPVKTLREYGSLKF